MYEPFFKALRSAGSEIINLGHIKADTQDILDKDVIDPEIYMKNANGNWREKEGMYYGKISK